MGNKKRENIMCLYNAQFLHGPPTFVCFQWPLNFVLDELTKYKQTSKEKQDIVNLLSDEKAALEN